MKPEEIDDIRTGEHWLCRLADELDIDLLQYLEDSESWQEESGDIALSLLEIDGENRGKHRGAMLKCRLWPYEKTRLLRAANGAKLEDWVRKVLTEAATNE